MNQIYAYAFLISAGLISIIPIYKYLYAKYYYVDTTPIHYWLNKKQKIKKRYKTFKKRNKKHLSVNKINRIGSYNRYTKIKLTKLNK
jgi:hypothetical protein